MEGDRVSIIAEETEINGMPFYTSKTSAKPQYMLDEEYHQHIIECASLAVKEACGAIYPNNKTMQAKLAEMISKKAVG